jgi:type I restriction enzyme R subunit
LALILAIQGEDFWQDITGPMLESARRRLRALIKLIEVERPDRLYRFRERNRREHRR